STLVIIILFMRDGIYGRLRDRLQPTLVLMAVTALVQWLALRPVDGLTLLTITVFVALAMLLLPPAVYDRVAAAWRPRFSSGSGMGSTMNQHDVILECRHVGKHFG